MTYLSSADFPLSVKVGESYAMLVGGSRKRFIGLIVGGAYLSPCSPPLFL